MTPDEKEVRDSGELVHRCDGSYRDYPEGTILIQQGVPGKWLDFPSCAAAAAFTRERKEQIRQVAEEICWLNAEQFKQRPHANSPMPPQPTEAVLKRILAREQAALAELKKGMRASQ